jgi:phosphatidylglycerol:prolipoprotein diacylglycerol transferase
MINGFSIGNMFIPYYSAMISLGILLAGALGFILTKRFLVIFEDFLIMFAYVAAFGFIGAKALYLFVIFDEIDWSKVFNPGYLRVLLSGGLVFYGGLIGGIISLPIVKKVHNIDVFYIAKAIIPCIPLAHAMGRLGCHLTGCCYGIRYDGIFHIIYHNNLFAPNDIALFPVQLLEAILNFIMTAILLAYLLKKGPVINAIYVYVLGYSVIRFILEFFRGDAVERGICMYLSTSQIISVILFTGTLLLIKHYKVNRKSQKVYD